MKVIEKLKKDKRGVMGIVIFFLILFTILIIGFIAVIGISAIDFVSDEVSPIMKDIGVVDGINISEPTEIVFTATDKIVAALPWLLTFSYVAMIVFSIIFVVAYKFNPHPAFIGVYFLFAVLLIFGAIMMSNMYEDLHQSGDELIGKGLGEQKSMSFLILHSPLIFAVIAFLVGIFIFAGNRDEGGFDV